jgi:hypothetical protein
MKEGQLVTANKRKQGDMLRKKCGKFEVRFFVGSLVVKIPTCAYSQNEINQKELPRFGCI